MNWSRQTHPHWQQVIEQVRELKKLELYRNRHRPKRCPSWLKNCAHTFGHILFTRNICTDVMGIQMSMQMNGGEFLWETDGELGGPDSPKRSFSFLLLWEMWDKWAVRNRGISQHTSAVSDVCSHARWHNYFHFSDSHTWVLWTHKFPGTIDKAFLHKRLLVDHCEMFWRRAQLGALLVLHVVAVVGSYTLSH